MKITVHGFTGAQGSPVAFALQAAGHQVVGITRNAQPGERATVAADLDDQASLEAAYAGSDAVFVHLPVPTSPDDPARWVPSILGALTASNVRRVVLSTSGASLTDAGPAPMLQARLQGTQAFYGGLQSVVESVVALAPRLFLENLLLPFVSGPAITDGVLAYPLPADKPISWISHLDVAKAAVVAFDDATEAGVYDLGIDAITGDELAARISSAFGEKIRYEAISPAEFTARATPLFGPDMATAVGGLYEALATDQTLQLPAGTQRIATEQRLTVEDWARTHIAAQT